MAFNKIFSKFFKAKKTKSAEKFELASISDIEIVAKYRLVYNNDTKKYEKILVYNENDLEDVKNE